MSVCIYDRALTEKFKQWTEGTDIMITSPEETRRLFETMLDKTGDSPIKLPFICLRRALGYTVNVYGKKSLTYQAFRRDITTDGATFVNVIPVTLNYQVDVYARHYEEAEDYMRNLIFNIVNYPKFKVEVPYKNIDFGHYANMLPGQEVSDNSNVSERLSLGQFTRLSYRFDVDEAFLWDVRSRGSVKIVSSDVKVDQYGNETPIEDYGQSSGGSGENPDPEDPEDPEEINNVVIDNSSMEPGLHIVTVPNEDIVEKLDMRSDN